MDTQDSQTTIRLPLLLLITLFFLTVGSVVSYRVGKGQAYKEIMKSCIENKVSAGICFLASKESVDNVIKIVNEVMEAEINQPLSQEEVAMFLEQSKG